MSSPISECRSLDFFAFGPEETSALKSPVIPEDLRSALQSECSESVMPMNLIHNSFGTQPECLLSRGANLFQRLTLLSPYQPQRIRELQDFYKYQTALVETDRYRSLLLDDGHGNLKEVVNQFYDQELLLILERVEASVTLLEQSVISSNEEANAIISRSYLRAPGVRTRSLLSKPAVRLMEQWYSKHLDHPYPSVEETDALAKSRQYFTRTSKEVVCQ